jgi:hypothetical protein
MTDYQVVDPCTIRATEQGKELEAKVLEYRSAGLSFPQIAREMGCTQRYAFALYRRALKAIISPKVEELRKQEGERLDAMLIPVMSVIMSARNNALSGLAFELPVDAINAALKISERRARIFGLDAPVVKTVNKNPFAPTTPLDMLQNMNLSTMDNSELLKLRDLLKKASDSGGPEGADEFDDDA